MNRWTTCAASAPSTFICVADSPSRPRFHGRNAQGPERMLIGIDKRHAGVEPQSTITIRRIDRVAFTFTRIGDHQWVRSRPAASGLVVHGFQNRYAGSSWLHRNNGRHRAIAFIDRHHLLRSVLDR